MFEGFLEFISCGSCNLLTMDVNKMFVFTMPINSAVISRFDDLIKPFPGTWLFSEPVLSSKVNIHPKLLIEE